MPSDAGGEQGVQTAFRLSLRNEITADLSNWRVSLSASQMSAFIAHIEQLILTNSGTVIADVTSDLAFWKDPPKGHHT